MDDYFQRGFGPAGDKADAEELARARQLGRDAGSRAPKPHALARRLRRLGATTRGGPGRGEAVARIE